MLLGGEKERRKKIGSVHDLFLCLSVYLINKVVELVLDQQCCCCHDGDEVDQVPAISWLILFAGIRAAYVSPEC